MKSTQKNYEGENRSLHMKERIGYGVGDFANNMMYTPVNSFFTYFLTNIAGLGAGVVGTILLLSRIMDGVSDLIVGTFMEKLHSKHGKARPWLLWWCIPFAVSFLVGNLSIFQNIASFAAFAVCIGIIKKVGKQKIALAGVSISFIGYAMVLLNPTSYALLYTAAVVKGVGNAALSGVMYGMLADTVEYNDWNAGIRAEGLVFSANSIGQKIGSGIGSAVLGWVLAAFGFVSSSATQPLSAINGIRVIFLYVPLVVFAAMFIILLFYKLDKEYDGIVASLEKRASMKRKNPY